MAEKRRRKKTEKLDLQCPKVCLDYDEVPRAVGDDGVFKDGGWEQHGFRNQGPCIRFIETGTQMAPSVAPL